MVRRGRRVVVLLTLVFLASGPALAAGDQIFFVSHQSHRQVVPLSGESSVTVESWLREDKVEVRRGADGEVTLDIAGTYSIAGYHGSREDAGAVDLREAQLAFRISRTAQTLTLTSPEWWYIHHTLSLDRLTITVPTSVTVTLARKQSDD